MIRLEHISKYYQHNASSTSALSDVSLSIAKGEIFGVVGKSGAGKSTLIRCVNLLERPSQGKVFVDNEEMTALSQSNLRATRRQIGMIFQHFNLLESRTVSQNIAFPLHLVKRSKKFIADKVDSLLELTGLTDKRDHYPSQLSGGQKQRVAIARALANDPKILLCDEATSALDPETTRSILALLKEINNKLQLTILLITHEMEVVKQICDRVAVLDQGKIVEISEITQFFAKPNTEIAKNLIKTCIREELPPLLQNRIYKEARPNTKPILRILFHGEAAKEPLISHLMQELALTINILQANIEIIKDDTFGIMIIEAIGDDPKINQALKYLREKDVEVEVLGYAD